MSADILGILIKEPLYGIYASGVISNEMMKQLDSTIVKDTEIQFLIDMQEDEHLINVYTTINSSDTTFYEEMIKRIQERKYFLGS